MSASGPLSISRASRICELRFLKRRYFVASLASEPCSRADGRQLRRIGQRLGIDEPSLQFLESRQFFVERIGHGSDAGCRKHCRLCFSITKAATPARVHAEA